MSQTQHVLFMLFMTCARWRSWVAYCFGILALVLVVGLVPETSAADSEEGLIIAVDVSGSMRKKLPAVKRAIYTLVDGLDPQRRYHVALVRFGAITEQVIELELDNEVARGVLRSAVQDLQANQQWTHFDELAAYLMHKVPSFGTARVSALLYSDGLCSIKPGLGKHCLDLTDLGTRVPFHDFNLYMVRITTTPRPQERPAVVADAAERMHVIEAKLDALTEITGSIVQRIEASPVPSVPPAPPAPPAAEPIPVPAPQPEQTEEHSLPDASGALSETTPEEASTPEQPHTLTSHDNASLAARSSGVPQWVWLLILLGAGGSMLGVVWWRWRFHPITLVVTLDGTPHEASVDTVPTELRIGPTLGCDVLAETLPAVCRLLVQRRGLGLNVPPQWHVENETMSRSPALQEDGTALYPIVGGATFTLVTPSGAHSLVVDQRPADSSTEKDDESQDLSPLTLLGLHNGE